MNTNNKIQDMNINENTFFKKVADKYVYIIAFFIGIVIICLGAYIFIGPFVTITGAISSGSYEEKIERFTNTLIEYQGVLTLLGNGLGIILSIALLRKIFIEDAIALKTNWKRCLICFGAGIVSIFLLGYLFDYLQVLFGIEGSSQNQELLELSLNGRGKLAMILSIVIAAPIFEELVFRKFIYGYLSRTKLHIVVNIIIVAFIFALIHCIEENFLKFSAYFFLLNYLALSLSITVPYALSKGNIYVSILIHMFNNTLSLLYFYGVISAIL